MAVSPRKASVLLLVLLVLALFVGACGPPPRPNNPPIANAGPDQAGVPLGLSVQLSGSGSSDPEGKPLSYAWMFNQRPTGSLAALQNATSVQCSFTPDVAGGYVIRLTVSDGNASSADTVTITAGSGGGPGNNAPVANAGADQSVSVGQVVTLDGSGSTDADGDPLTYQWAWVMRPTGSTAVLSGLNTINASFTPDQAGTYTVSLTVSDGQAIDTDDVAVTVSPSAGGGVTTFAFTLVDAAYSRTLKRLIMAEYHLSRTRTIVDDEFCLHVYDPVTGIDQAVKLEMRPNCLALSPDGRYAAVGHDGRISYIDLSATPPTVSYLNQCPVNVVEIMLPGDGYVYAFPDLATDLVPLTIINLTTGVKSPDMFLPKIVQIAARPNAANTAFAVDGKQLFEYTLGAGTITAAWLYVVDGTLRYEPGDNLWFSRDGDRLITQSGKIYWWNPDLMYHGSLDLTTELVSLDHIIGASAQELYAIIPAFPEDFEVVVYGYDFHSVRKIMGLPEVTYGSVTEQWPGKFVFFSAAGDVMYVLAAPLSNDACAIITLATP